MGRKSGQKLILHLDDRHWDNREIPMLFDYKHKGRAIDRKMREQVNSTSHIMEPYDWECELPEFGDPPVRYHEFKSTSGKTISISRMELDFAQRKYRDGYDILYWVIDQGSDRDTFFIRYLIRYSTLAQRHLLNQSQFDNDSAFFYADHCEVHGIGFS